MKERYRSHLYPRLLDVPPALEFEKLDAGNGKIVIRVWVPMGPSLYSFKGIVYDRAADVDVKVKATLGFPLTTKSCLGLRDSGPGIP